MPTITIGAPIPAYRPHQGQYYLWLTIHFSHRHHYGTLWRDGFLFASVHTNIEALCGGGRLPFSSVMVSALVVHSAILRTLV